MGGEQREMGVRPWQPTRSLSRLLLYLRPAQQPTRSRCNVEVATIILEDAQLTPDARRPTLVEIKDTVTRAGWIIRAGSSGPDHQGWIIRAGKDEARR